MFDSIPTTEIQGCASDWKTSLAPGDVVALRLPASSPRTRTCLVLDVERRGARPIVRLACGTSSPRPSNRHTDIDVRSRADCRQTGLEAPTRFVGTDRLRVPLDHPAFAISPATGSPVLGRLHGAPLKRMQSVRGWLHACADIRAERRREKAASGARRDVSSADAQSAARKAR